jgi:hypothetical protein
MSRVIATAMTCLGVWGLGLPGAAAQSVTRDVRVAAGRDNLSDLRKQATVADEGLRTIITDGELSCLLLVKETTTPAKGGESVEKYYVQYAKGRRTKVDRRDISKEDYESLRKLLDRLDP